MLTGRQSAVLGLLLGAIFCAAAAWTVDWQQLGAVIVRAKPGWMVLVAMTVVGCLLVKTMRWRAILGPVLRTGTRELFPAVCAGNAGNYLLPHLGEFVRVLIVGHRFRVSQSAVLASIVVERLFDFAALALLSAMILLPGEVIIARATGAIWLIGLLALALFAAIAALVIWTEPLLLAIEGMTFALPAAARRFVVRELRNSAPALAALRRPATVAPVLVLSALHWTLIGVTVDCSLRAAGIASSPDAVTAVVLLNAVGLLLPAAPGHVGTIQLAFGVALHEFGVEWEPAIAASILYNSTVVAVVMLLGLYPISRAGWRVGAVLRSRPLD